MRKFLLIASAAAMAATMPALAEKGGKGGGNGGGKGQAAEVHGGGHGGGKVRKMEGGHGGGHAKAPKAERQAFGGDKPDKAQRHPDWRGGKPAKAERKAVKQEVKRQERLGRDGFGSAPALVDTRFFNGGDGRLANLGQSCPPGLARKNNGCLPPGQAKKVFGLGDRLQPTWFSGYQLPEQYRAFYSDTPEYYYRYNEDGYIYRVERDSNLISGLIPLLGGGFAVGQPLPAGFDVYNVPLQYRDVYQDTDESYYRYGDDAIYRVDAESGIIESIVALLGGGLNVGQQLPSGFDAYNVPLDYRDEYSDTADYNYRYADGNIYQVDAKTQIIQAIVEMLV